MTGRPVYFVDGLRTPFLKARGKPGVFAASDLAVQAGRQLLARLPLRPEDVDELVIGCAMPSPDEANIARVIALRLGCGEHVPAYTVMRNCASAMQALDSAAKDIALGRCELALAGGTEAMSRAPVLFNDDAVTLLAALNQARTPLAKLTTLTRLRRKHLSPVLSLVRGLTDPIVGLNMGQTCEVISHRFAITRAAMDAYAVNSHQRLARAYDEGRMGEVAPLFDTRGRLHEEDDGLRRDSSTEKLARLRPFFDRSVGLVTAGNSSQVTDGAALLLLASADAVERYRLPVLGKLVDVEWAALDPAQMGLGPVHAATPILKRQELSLTDLDSVELNEAFAGQVLACIAAWEDDAYCTKQLGLDGALGTLAIHRLNVDGGAISLGHPVGASGARIVLHALEVLKRTGGRRALATLCIGGGQGGAMLVERQA
ncbi:MAG: acetyl-CoA C-acetyltransferase [Pseudomonadota bacterium]